MKNNNIKNYLDVDETRYRSIYKFNGRSALLKKIWVDAYGRDYPEAAEPFGFVTNADLDRIVEELKVKEGETLLDMGCGRGGPGLLVARRTKAKLVGMDIVKEAVQQAQTFKKEFNLSEDAEFITGSFTDTNLPDSSVDAVMSVDAFWMVLDKKAAVKEIARIIKPGSRFVFTTWVTPHVDLHSLLRENHFNVLLNMETPGWEKRQLTIYRNILEYQEELKKEIGKEASAMLVSEATHAPDMFREARRVLVVAERLPVETREGNRKMRFDEKSIAASQSLKEREYWLNKFSGELVKSSFFFDYRPVEMEVDGSQGGMNAVKFRFIGQPFTRLMTLRNNSDYILHMILTAGVVLLLHRYTGHHDIIVAAPVDKQDIDAEFINTVLALGNHVTADMTFKELLLQVRQTILEAVENQNYPVETLLYDLNIPLTGGDCSLFDVAVLLENIHDKQYLQHIPLNVVFTFLRTGNIVEGALEYNSRLYDKRTIERIVMYFTRLLERAIADVNLPLIRIDMLSEEERRQLLFDFNDTQTGYPADKTVHGLFREEVEKNPDCIALVYDRMQLTYRELDRKAHGLAGLLVKKGVQPDHFVGIMAERSLEMIVGLLAILKAGAAYLPLDPEYPEERITFMLEDSEVTVLLIHENQYQHNPDGFNGEIIHLEQIDDDTGCGSGEGPNPDDIRGELAYIIYTSGSTGKPKGTVVRHRSIVNTLYWRKNYYQFDQRDVVLQLPSFSFDSSVEDIFTPLISSSKLVLIQQENRLDTKYLGKLITEHAVTHFLIIPNLYKAFLEEIHESIKGLIKVTVAGESFTEALVREHFEKLNHVELYNEYGPTENSVCATVYKFSPEQTRVLIGKPIANVSCYVLGRNRELNPIGVPGQLCISGASLAVGYFNNDELTQMKFVTNPFIPGERMYETGDLAKWQPDGNLEFLGRMDSQLKIRGFRIEPGEIENQLLKHDQINEAVVFAREDREGNKFLCAYLVTSEKLDLQAVKDHLSLSLPNYMIPAQFCMLERMPLTPSGKIDRKTLSRMDGAMVNDEEYIAPRNEIEKKMVEIWQKVLEVETIGIKDNYFNRGGDSIKAIKLLSLINTELKGDLKIVDLFTTGTIEKLSALVTRARASDSGEGFSQVLEEVETLKERILSQKTFPGKIEDIYPMSDIEKGMVFHGLIDSAASVFHNQLVHQVKIRDFDEVVFGKALGLMVEKHPILRTTFSIEEFEEAVQIVHQDIAIDCQHYHISHLDKSRQEEFIGKLMEEDRQNPFDIASYEPLWRVRTFTLNNETVCLLWVSHHAILDGWSTASLLTELNNAYFELRANGHYVPGKLKSSYKDFIIQQMVMKRSSKIINYWKSELEDYRRLEFPGAGSGKGSDGIGLMKKYDLSLELPLLEKLKQTAEAYDTNVKCLCFAAYVYMLNMLSYENDVVVGLVTNNRPVCEDGDKILGCYLSTIPVRIRVPAKIKVSDYIKLVDEKLLELTEYGSISLFEITRVIGEDPQDRNPIFDTMFNFIDFHVFQKLQRENLQPDAEGKDKGLLSVEGTGNANLLFNFNVDLTLGHFYILVYYASAALDEELTGNLCRCFAGVLNKMAHDTGDILEKNEWLTPGDKLYDFHTAEAARHYWKKYLESYDKPAAIPGKRNLHDGEKGYPWEEVTVVLGEDETAGLTRLAAHAQLSLNAIVQTAWGILLSKYNDRKDVVFGSAVPAVSGADSLLWNIVPVRVCYQTQTTLKDLLQQAEQETAESRPHQHYPLAEVQAEMGLNRQLLDHVLMVKKEQGWGQMEEMVKDDCDFYIIVLTDDSRHSLKIKFKYDSHQYERNLLKRIAGDYTAILNRIIEYEDVRIIDIELESHVLSLKKADIDVNFNI